MRKTDASSGPMTGETETSTAMARGKNPRMGTLWRTSRAGMMRASSLLLVAAAIPTTKAAAIESRRATAILAHEAPRAARRSRKVDMAHLQWAQTGPSSEESLA
jgi:hypothetical protein